MSSANELTDRDLCTPEAYLSVLLSAADHGGFVVIGAPPPPLLQDGLLHCVHCAGMSGFELTRKGWDRVHDLNDASRSTAPA